MEKRGNPQRRHCIWTGVIFAGGMLVAFLALFVSQAFAAGITVTSATIDDGATVYPTVYEANWVTRNVKAWTFTPNVTAGAVTTVSVSGTATVTNRAIRVQLLNGAATIISSGCIAVTATTFSVTVDVVPDVTFSSVARVKALGGNLPCP
jgi:hypothetical protein